jgi:glycosyltransferase involved in cell wall biosynthesis
MAISFFSYKHNDMKVYIDSACDILYSSFYIEGIRKIFKRRSIEFSSKYFTEFRHNNNFFCFVVEEEKHTLKIVIDFSDGTKIDNKAYNWSNVYAKINILYKDFGKYKKLISIGPGFGVRIFSIPATTYYAISNLLKSLGRVTNVKRFLSNYKAQLNRPTLAYYNEFIFSEGNYIYFASSLWRKETETNNFRANFIRAAKSIEGIKFEGGFAPRALKDIDGFDDITMIERASFSEYFGKIKSSIVVFNTPAVLNCHGWKLGEYLALGEAIISTPISRVLPVDLEEGKHYILTDGTEENIKQQLIKLIKDPELRRKLACNAKKYYCDCLAPDKIIERILKIAQ